MAKMMDLSEKNKQLAKSLTLTLICLFVMGIVLAAQLKTTEEEQ